MQVSQYVYMQLKKLYYDLSQHKFGLQTDLAWLGRP